MKKFLPLFLVFLACAVQPKLFTPPVTWEYRSTQNLIALLNIPNITNSRVATWESGDNIFVTQEISFSDRFDVSNGEQIIRANKPENSVIIYPQRIRDDFNNDPRVFAWESIYGQMRAFMVVFEKPDGTTGGVLIGAQNSASALDEYEEVIKSIRI